MSLPLFQKFRIMVNCISCHEENYMLSVHRQLDVRYTSQVSGAFRSLNVG